jgi:hypothetical protein
VAGGGPVREAGLFTFNALPPQERTLVRGTLFGFAGAGAAGGAGTAGGAGAGAVIDAVWMRCVPALFLLFTLVAATIFATSAEVGRPPAAPRVTCSAGLPPAGCGVESRSMPSGSGRGRGGGGCGGTEIGGGGGGRVGRDEGAEASRAQNGPSSMGRVRVASKTLVSAGRTRILGSALNFFLPFPSFKGADP